VNISNVSYILAHSNTKLIRVLAATPYTVSDITASVATTTNVSGAIFWGNRYIYAALVAGNREVHGWDLASTDTVLISGFSTSNAETSMANGPDGNLYLSGGQGYFAQVTSVAGTSGNTNVFHQIDTNMTVRKILNDGRYLVLICDNNAFVPSSRTVGNYQCRVYFWDLIKTQSGGVIIQPDIVWDNFPGESYFVGAEIREGMIYAWGQANLWNFNSATPPRIVRPFIGSANLSIQSFPTSCYQISGALGSIFWGDGSANGNRVYAYGNPLSGQQAIFYQPYTHGDLQCTALLVLGSLVFTATGNSTMFAHNDTTSTRNDVTVQPVITTLMKQYSYNYVKVTLTSPLITGQTVTCEFLNGAGSVISGNDTRTYSASKPSQTFIFRRTAGSNLQEKFEEGYPVVTGGKCAIQRIAVYATPISDSSEDI
jgi:hypothetical protein